MKAKKNMVFEYVYNMIRCQSNKKCEGCIEDAKAIIDMVRLDERKKIIFIIETELSKYKCGKHKKLKNIIEIMKDK
jgi:hypothetical protein